MSDPSETNDLPRRGASAWDGYVARSQPSSGRWAGDEWGDARLWSAWFRRLFEPHGVDEWQRAIEIGQGSGKYTRLVLEAGGSQVLAVDISRRFIAQCEARLGDYVSTGRLRLELVDECDPDGLAAAARRVGWNGGVDAVYSIDTLVHLTVHQVAALLLSATELLREGGWFMGTFADATTPAGMRKLLADLDWVVRGGGDPVTGCFHWMSPEIVRALAQSAGYEVVLCDVDPEHRRDGHFVLKFADPRQAAASRSLRRRIG